MLTNIILQEQYFVWVKSFDTVCHTQYKECKLDFYELRLKMCLIFYFQTTVVCILSHRLHFELAKNELIFISGLK